VLKIIFGLSVLLLTGCATSYQSQSFTGGYSETQIDENVFIVSFEGNGYTKRERASDLALLRSAELTLQSEFKYFVIIDSDSYSSTSYHTTPTTYNTTSNAKISGNNIYGSSRTTSSGGNTYKMSKPSESNTIVCFKEKPSNTFSYNAEFIYKSMSEKYGVPASDEPTLIQKLKNKLL